MTTNNLLNEQNAIKGILICLLCYFFIALIGIAEKLISPEISVCVILFFQNFICLILTARNVMRTDASIFKITQRGTYLIRILSGIGCYAVLFYMIRFIPISEAMLYQYSAALWIPFIMLAWLNVKIPKKIGYGIIIGFIGLILILKPTDLFSKICFLGIISGILQAFSVVAVRKLLSTEPVLRILFYYFLIGTLITLPLLIENWSPIGINDFLLLLGVGLSTFLAQKYFTLSLKYADPATLAPICYTSILFSGLLAWLFWHEVPGKESLLGMALIIVGCVFTMFVSKDTVETSTT